MPSDYASAAQALALPPSPSPDPEPTSSHRPSHNDRLPAWARSAPDSSDDLFRGPQTRGIRRLSTPYSRGGDSGEHRPLGQRIMQGSISIMNKLLKLGYSMTPLQRLLAAVAGLVFLALGIVFLVFSHRIFTALHPVAEGWRKLPGGWVLLFLLCGIAAFPPMIGYSMTITIAGFIFGFPGGWPIVAGATVVGSTAAFFASRTVLSGYVQRLVGEDRRFVALGQVLRHDGLPVLVAIRFCPLPFSLSNGFLATIPSISPGSFALATALATPKLLVHVFIGDRLGQLVDNEDMPTSTRVINYISIILGSAVGITVGWFVYQRTMRRAKELALEEGAATDGNGVLLTDEPDYNDVEEGVVQNRWPGESDSAALMDDDDISLWDATGDNQGTYRDESDTDTNPSPSRPDFDGTQRHADTR